MPLALSDVRAVLALLSHHTVRLLPRSAAHPAGRARQADDEADKALLMASEGGGGTTTRDGLSPSSGGGMPGGVALSPRQRGEPLLRQELAAQQRSETGPQDVGGGAAALPHTT